MRRTNWRLVVTGVVMILLAFGFFIFMAGMTGRSNDPAALMQTVGSVSGVVGGLGAVMAIVGLIGKRRQDAA
jgi:ammonia channel protein AmtB